MVLQISNRLVTDSINGMEMNPTRPLLFKRGGRNFQVYKEDRRKWCRGEANLEAIQFQCSLLGCDTMQSGR